MGEISINHPAAVAAALSMFVIGGIWYGPLFGRAWQRASGLGDEDPQGSNPLKQYGLSFLFSLGMAYNLAAFLGDAATTIAWGATAGFLAGFGWVALGIGVISLFEQRSWSYILINGGYMTVAFTVMGVILGAWR